MHTLSRPILLCIVFALATVVALGQEDSLEEKHRLVAMRMLGHHFLLSQGDAGSRVLPVVKDGEQYRISFENRLSFNPENMVAVADSIMQMAHINQPYLVEVEDCDSKEIVHSFEAGRPGGENLLPCRGRPFPESCYSLLVSLLDEDETNTLNSQALPVEANSDAPPKVFGKGMLILLAAFLISASFFYLQKRKRLSQNSEKILIGASEFDQRNMAISFKNKTVELSNKESELLQLLHNSANVPVEREVILQKVWGDDGDYVGRTLDVFISKLRKKLEADESVKIVNIRGVGYKLVTGKRS